MPQVFLSHSDKDKAIVLKIAEHFQNSFIETWLDKEDIPIGGELAGKIFSGISQSSYFLPFISNHYVQSSWCLDELKAAYSPAQKDQIKILPVLLEARDKLALKQLKPDDGPFLKALLDRFKYIEFDIYDQEKSIQEILDAVWQEEAIAFEPLKVETIGQVKLQVIRFHVKVADLPDDFLSRWQMDLEKFHEQGSGKLKIIKSDWPVAFNGKGPIWLYCYFAVPLKNLNDVFIFNTRTNGYICIYSKRKDLLGKVLK